MNLGERIDRVLERLDPAPGPAIVAVSGGPDSVALLDLLASSRSASQLSLHIAHLDHGIHPDSYRALELVRRLADGYGLPFHEGRLALGPDTSETRAREARYDWLEQVADQLGAKVIFTAHQRDDQVETVLMRILRGTGPAGLAGMSMRRGRVVRPLLAVPRDLLLEHIRDRGLPTWDDPANRDPRHQRSWVRIELLPFLRERVPDIDRRLYRLARQAARQRAAWDRLLDREGLDFRSECDGVSVAASPLSNYDSPVVWALLGALGRRASCHVGPMRAARIEQLLAGGRSGAVVQLGNGCAAELSFGRLRLFREPVPDNARVQIRLEGAGGKGQVGQWELEWSTEPAPDRLERISTASWFSPGQYVVRLWKPGDRIRPLGGNGRRLVVRCMQDAHIARHSRAGWPVVERGGTIVWVPGVSRSDEAIPAAGEPALRIDVQHR
jgi:tRNA(Ile)-lysidine synthase